MSNDARFNDPGLAADSNFNEICRLEYEQECLEEGTHTVRLTDRQLWFMKCAVEARTAVLPVLPSQLDPQTFYEDFGINQAAMQV